MIGPDREQELLDELAKREISVDAGVLMYGLDDVAVHATLRKWGEIVEVEIKRSELELRADPDEIILERIRASAELLEERAAQAAGVDEKPDPDGAPDLTSKVLAFRSWQLDDDLRLTSTGHGATRWLPGAQRASCKAQGDDPRARRLRFGRKRAERGHQAPEKDCSCGFYALHDWREAAQMAYGGGYIVGGVTAWGKIEVHHSGIRAEWIEIVGLSVPEPILIDDPELAGKAAQLASDYGVELVPLTELASAVAEAGSAVPKRLRPRAPDFERSPGFASGGMVRGVSMAAAAAGLSTTSGASIRTAATRMPRVVGTAVPFGGASYYYPQRGGSAGRQGP